MNVAIPEFKDAVAPCFEAATSFVLARVEGRSWKRLTTIRAQESGGYRRVRLLLFHNVELLICNGINASHRDTLAAAGVLAISGVNTLVNEALADLAEGRLQIGRRQEPGNAPVCRFTHEQLVVWAHELFSKGGYQVLPGPGEDSFLVDLIAEVDCPLCSRLVRVAICCGAHTYKSQQEIKAFHHATPSGYDARVYVCPAEEQIVESCREYGIEVIDPGDLEVLSAPVAKGKLPILQSTVAGHERASATAGHNPN